MELIHKRPGFWKENDYPYSRVVEITAKDLEQLVSGLSREDLIEWLVWNDRNGVYTDEDSLREFGAVMTREEATEIILRQAAENRVNQLTIIR
ncbi:MAG TPA: hypothetical protein VNW95_09370 [Mucilaginibacter sp.]|jgi:hypothetical protein|nr:hypothetical protein [Mucilaginibacter sp.]